MTDYIDPTFSGFHGNKFYVNGVEVNATIETAEIDALAVTTAKLAADAVTGAKIADDAVDSEHIVDGSIDPAHLAANAVETAKIAADAVNGTKIADDAVDSEHIVDGSVDPAHLAALAVETAKIAAAAVTRAKLAGAFNKMELVAGQDETGDTTIPVTGLAAGDELVRLLVQDGTSGVFTSRAGADFTVGADNLTVVANAANNTSNKYLIFWTDLT